MRRDPRWRANPSVQERAKQLRRPMTPAEEALWGKLRRNGVADLHFRRQHAIGRFILDFYCASKRLAIEVDGAVHEEQRDYDEVRTEVLQRMNIRVLRFTNEEVLSNLPSVVRRIELAAEPEPEEQVSPLSRAAGEGGRGGGGPRGRSEMQVEA